MSALLLASTCRNESSLDSSAYSTFQVPIRMIPPLIDNLMTLNESHLCRAAMLKRSMAPPAADKPCWTEPPSWTVMTRGLKASHPVMLNDYGREAPRHVPLVSQLQNTAPTDCHLQPPGIEHILWLAGGAALPPNSVYLPRALLNDPCASRGR
jgi:hypothetical protein